MNYANLPTPPSSNEDSPRPAHFSASPNFNRTSGDNVFIMNPQGFLIPDIAMAENASSNTPGPQLHFLEEPVDKFRFRYKSEMAGTHGSLTGKSSDRSRKQTYPTVELQNYNGPAFIRCTIYQCDSADGEIKPHAHKLIMKKGKEEHDDPHELPVSRENDFKAAFHSMGIIHTAKKDVYNELYKKKLKLFKELVAQNDSKFRELSKDEIAEIMEQAVNESRTINLNIACLRFDAIVYKDDVPYPICTPLYSSSINNLKSALTGELKIVRMDHCTSPSKGGREIFLLVERVTKKNIKVRFFELNDNDEEVWEGFGKFSDLDVHHQYAIVFKTPPYRDRNIRDQIKVYIELVRPSDSARSEPKEFTYIPTQNEYRPGMKRARNPFQGSSSYDSSMLDSDELPTTIAGCPKFMPSLELNVNSDDLENAWNNVDSEDFIRLLRTIECEDYHIDQDSPQLIPRQYQVGNVTHVKFETKREIERRKAKGSIIVAQGGDPVIISDSGSKLPLSHRISRLAMPSGEEPEPEDLEAALGILKDIITFLKTKPTLDRCVGLLNKYFARSDRTNALHLLVSENIARGVRVILKLMEKCEKTKLVNVCNSFQETPVVLAIINGHYELLDELVRVEGVDLTIPDGNCNTPLHVAIKCNVPLHVFESLLDTKCAEDYIDLTNADGYTPLILAIKDEKLDYVKILCMNKASINYQDPKNGFTALRYAVQGNSLRIVEYLLAHKDLNPYVVDFNQTTIFQAAESEGRPEIWKVVSEFMKNHEIKLEIKQEVPDLMSDEEEMETEDIIKEEPLNLEYLYANVNSFTDKCLTEVSRLLDESGNWEDLANLLDLSHCIKSGMISMSGSISKNLINYAIQYNDDTVLQIRNFLEVLGETYAVQTIDNMAKLSFV